jgi:prepilin signal peptidase PulO-like enzyme (type II secretory pathway)
MVLFISFLSFLFGTIIGSFLNVLILRHGTGRSVVSDRSACFSCGKTLRWYELVPVISYIALRGRCSSCQARISPQYPIVEIIVGLLYAGSFWKLSDAVGNGIYTYAEGVVLGVILAVFWMLVVMVSVYDIRHTIIPDEWVYPMIGSGVVYGVCTLMWGSGFTFSAALFETLLAGGVLAAPFAFLWLISRGTWMGLGDAKLILALGSFLGLLSGASALVLAVWIGAIIGVVLILLHKGRLSKKEKGITMKSEIPFGPFLILGTLLVYFLEIRVWEWFFII